MWSLRNVNKMSQAIRQITWEKTTERKKMKMQQNNLKRYWKENRIAFKLQITISDTEDTLGKFSLNAEEVGQSKQ